VASQPVQVHVTLPDIALTLSSDTGVFAHAKLDRGTELLLRTIPPPPSGAVLDLGCGYGAIAMVVARRNPRARVWAVDVNERAVALCRNNAAHTGTANVHAMSRADVPDDLRFDAIYSNPPVRIGKQALHALLSAWLSRLTPGGHAYLVVQRHLGADSLAEWLHSEGYSLLRLRSRVGYRVLDVTPQPQAPIIEP
jgi:16S rRNA (guanine1207-N2)-methyltransferase